MRVGIMRIIIVRITILRMVIAGMVIVRAAIFGIGKILEFGVQRTAQARLDRGKVDRPPRRLSMLMRFLDQPIGHVMRRVGLRLV